MSTTDISFEKLVELLAGAPLVGLGTRALAVRRPSGFFVPPTFTVTQEATGAPVVLLSARGAAGKSSTANALSERLTAPVWRLEDDTSVSYSSVHSTIVQHLGSIRALEQIAEMGHPLLIVDSLDEARARVSATSWSEFLQAIVEAVRRGLRVLLLGRTRTLEDLWVTFEDADLPVAWYEVSHFDEDARIRYVDERARARDPKVQVDSSPYIGARDAILAALAAPLPEVDANHFVGYPPVLDAVAQSLLDNPNYISLENEFATLRLDSRTAVLSRILEDLLIREQAKARPLAEDLGIPPNLAYTPQEQGLWLLRDLANSDDPPVLQDLPPSKRMEYLERIQVFCADHPFRNEQKWASPIFEAYVVAENFDDAPSDAIVAAGNTSGLLFELVCATSDDALLLDETQFAALHASLLAGQWRSTDSSVLISSESGSYEGEFQISEVGRGTRPVSFVLSTRMPDAIRLSGPLTSLTVNIHGDLNIPASGEDLVLGPDLHLHADAILVDGVRVAFGQRHNESGAADVEIQADTRLALPHLITPPLPRAGALEVIPPAGTKLSFPWSEYSERAPESFPKIDDRAVRFLNKFMNLTRSHGHGGDRAVFVKKFQGRQGLPEPQFKAALAVLTKSGAAYVEGDMIFYSAAWEKHRYSGKSVPGQRSLGDCLDAWGPILLEITAETA